MHDGRERTRIGVGGPRGWHEYINVVIVAHIHTHIMLSHVRPNASSRNARCDPTDEATRHSGGSVAVASGGRIRAVNANTNLFFTTDRFGEHAHAVFTPCAHQSAPLLNDGIISSGCPLSRPMFAHTSTHTRSEVWGFEVLCCATVSHDTSTRSLLLCSSEVSLVRFELHAHVCSPSPASYIYRGAFFCRTMGLPGVGHHVS